MTHAQHLRGGSHPRARFVPLRGAPFAAFSVRAGGPGQKVARRKPCVCAGGARLDMAR